MKLKLFAIFLSLSLFAASLSGCQAFNRVDTYATAQAQNAAYEIEVAAMTEAATAEVAFINATIRAHETTIAHVNGVNQQLMRTLAIQVTPTPQIVVDSALPDTLSGNDPNTRPFIKTGVSNSINQGDGCVTNPQSFFTIYDTRLYATVKAFNISRGILMRAEWRREGVPVWEDVWTVDQDYDEICIWFYIEPSEVEFIPGGWSVEIFAEGASVDGEMPFTIEGSDAMMEDQ